MINVCTLMRNSEKYIERFFQQIETELVNVDYRIIIGEGDSTDKTREILDKKASSDNRIIVYDVSHGGKEFGSIVNEQRFLQLAYSGNIIWFQSSMLESHITIWIDSDLILEPYTILELVGSVKNESSAIYAPNILMGTCTFYDVWAFRKDGKHFKAKFPYYEHDKSNIMPEVDSVGGIVAMHSEIAKYLYFPAKDVFVGLCKQAKDINCSIYLAYTLKAYHK